MIVREFHTRTSFKYADVAFFAYWILFYNIPSHPN